jgi:leucyl aminopeptidase
MNIHFYKSENADGVLRELTKDDAWVGFRDLEDVTGVSRLLVRQVLPRLSSKTFRVDLLDPQRSAEQFFCIKKAVADLEDPSLHVYIAGEIRDEDVLGDLADTFEWIDRFAKMPPNIIFPESFVDHVRTSFPDLSVRVINGEEKTTPLIHAVGKGSTRKPLLLVIEHLVHDKTNPVVFVGKGVTYDSGGYSLKPTQHMIDMKLDKTGACVVVGLMHLLRRFESKTPAVGICPLVENMVDGGSYRNDDVIQSMVDGLRVQVTNTDAEGRLILGDAIAYAFQNYSPSRIIDVATLTDTAVSLGDNYTALMGTDEELIPRLLEIGETLGDPFWRLPYSKKRAKAVLYNNSGNLVNSHSKNCTGYSVEGGLFIGEFVKEKTPWTHIDIGGSHMGGIMSLLAMVTEHTQNKHQRRFLPPNLLK